ncbi:minor capsid protein [Eubacterium ventriosum]|uniref:minor capsid protein n=1 Tax=Eubacterium ventriosum TaxID=39496 RepID=UPI002673A0AE|nr:minor capsid protein [Eubacterium ventriosum]
MANSYWEKRSIDVEKLIQEKNDQTVIKVNEFFEAVMKELNEQIRKIFSTYLTDSGMSIQEALKMLNTKQTRDAYNTLKRIYERTDDPDLKQEILNRLNAPAYASRIARIEALRDLIFCEAQSVGWYTEKMLQPRMIDVYNTAFYQTHYTIQKGTGLAYDFNNLSNPAVKAAIATDWKGSNYSKRIWKNTNQLANDLEEILTRGLMTGISGKKMAAELNKRMQSGRYEADRLIRTEVNYVAGQARLKAYGDTGAKKYIYIATLDLRTSAVCRKLDKTIHLVKDAEVGVNFPPMHPNCRSVDSAYIDGRDYSKLQRRARNPITGETELVPANMTYREWYKKYVESDARARANERAIKKGIKRPYRMSDEELKKAIKQLSH